jgi:hypothetical protein
VLRCDDRSSVHPHIIEALADLVEACADETFCYVCDTLMRLDHKPDCAYAALQQVMEGQDD